jgi:hypothetical protein
MYLIRFDEKLRCKFGYQQKCGVCMERERMTKWRALSFHFVERKKVKHRRRVNVEHWSSSE